MNSLEIMKRHLGKEEEVELEDGEKILMAPLPAEFIPELLVIQLKLDRGEITKDVVQMIQTCIIESLKVINPCEGMTTEEYDKLLNSFASRYYFKLSQKMFDLNRGGMTEKDIENLEKIRQKTQKK